MTSSAAPPAAMPHEAPNARLTAWAEAWPLTSGLAFTQASLELGWQQPGILDEGTERIAQELEGWLRPRAAGRSLEALRLVRERAWAPRDPPTGRWPRRIRLVDHLTNVAKLHLASQGRRVTLRQEPGCDLADQAAQWRWLSLALPADLLIAALCSSEESEPPGDWVAIGSPHVERLLHEERIPENHLHAGAAVSFAQLWSCLMGGLRGWDPEPRSIDLDRHDPFGPGERFARLILAAGLCRLLLAAFLWKRERGGTTSDLAQFAETYLESCSQDAAGAWGAALKRSWLGAIRGVVHGGELPRAAELRYAHQLLCGPGPHAEALSELLAADPISRWLPAAEGRALPETRFLARSLAYLRSAREGREDREFARLFWQLQRVRCRLFRHLTLEPGTAGLGWFRKSFAALKPFRAPLDRGCFEAALRHESGGLSLGSIELRLAPSSGWGTIRDAVQGLDRQVARFTSASGLARPEVGLIYHFTKERERGRGRSRRSSADPGGPFGCRFGGWYKEKLSQAMAIERALEVEPRSLRLLRGIDVASDELAVPTWAFAPLIRRVRAASRQASARLASAEPRWRAEPMRFTCHAGEEFRTLAEGLRRIHELLGARLLEPGDRLGHALALGVPPERWTACGGQPQPSEERLDDLLWEIDLQQKGEMPLEPTRHAFARAEALQLGADIFASRAPGLEALLDLRRLRLEGSQLERFGFPFLRRPASLDEPQTLLWRYLTDPSVFERGQRPVEGTGTSAVREGELRMLAATQRWLRSLLARQEISVEGNPSSNLLIGDHAALEMLPLFRLCGQQAAVEAPEADLWVSLSSDDPVSFATRLADEYAYAYFALLRDGLPAAEALGWLQRRCREGWMSRFTLETSATSSPAPVTPSARGAARPG